MLIPVFLSAVAVHFSPVFTDTHNVHRKKRSEDFVPCERGWYYFRDKCYKGAGRTLSERLSWDRALARCRSYKADLVSIESQEEHDFVTAFPLMAVHYFAWTGLNDRENESDYKWTDGTVFNYTNWGPGEPTGAGNEAEDCVHLLFLHPPGFWVGDWNDRACDVSDGYICEGNANPRKRSNNPMYCSPEAGGGYKYETSCYHVVTEMKSWKNAERFCKDNYNGHLVTINDKLEDVFLNYVLANLKDGVWIGIKVQEQLQQKWTSEWYVSYNGFQNEERNFIEGTCVARKTIKEWVMIPCSKELPFICEVYQERPPILKLAARGAHCPGELYEWRDLGGEYCYHIETTKSLNFYEASFDCKRRGGDLVSLHSREEAEILRPFVQYMQYSVYIGLVRSLPHEDTFAWTDGSTLDYQNWNHMQPDNVEEKCVEAVTHDIYRLEKMGWRDINCEEKRAYICSVKKVIPSSSVFQEAENCENYCIVSKSYLSGLIRQSSEAKRIPGQKKIDSVIRRIP